MRAATEAGDFRSPDVKTLHVGGCCRAKPDRSNRSRLQFACCGAQTVCLASEMIEDHACDKSRFLRGAPVDEAKTEREPGADPAISADTECRPLRWLHATRTGFELPDKPIVFDDAQKAVRQLPAPELRARTRNGHFLPNPAMLLRNGEGWVPAVWLRCRPVGIPIARLSGSVRP